MQQIVRTLFLFLLLLALQAWAEQQQEAVSGLLWEVTAPQLKSPSYLFGTIHSEDERVLELPPAVRNALQRSTLFVMEMEPTAATQEQASRRMMQAAGQSLATQLAAPLYKQTVAAMEQHGIPEQVTAQLKPWAVVMILSMPKPRSGQFLDVMLYQSALAQKKGVAGLESVAEQLDTFDDLSQAMQIELLRHTLDHYAEIALQTETLIQLWLARDLLQLQRLAEESSAGLPREIEEALQQRMIDERNARMVERMVPLLQQQSSFIAVGALHLPGEQGVITLLRQRGYLLRPLY